MSVSSVHGCGLWVPPVFLAETERCWRNYRVWLLVLKSWIWRNSQWPGDTIALTTPILVSKAEWKLVFTQGMETELALDIFSRMAIARWPYHHSEGVRLNSLCCCGSPGNSSCCPVTVNLWQINSPVQIQTKICGQHTGAWENIIWGFTDRRILWLLFSSSNIIGSGRLKMWLCFKGKCNYDQVSLGNVHYTAGNTIPPACIWCNHITCHNVFQVSISTLFNFSCFIVFSS